MPYVKFSKHTWFEETEYVGRKIYMVEAALAKRMKEQYPASCAVFKKRPKTDAPVGNSVAPDLEAAGMLPVSEPKPEEKAEEAPGNEVEAEEENNEVMNTEDA